MGLQGSLSEDRRLVRWPGCKVLKIGERYRGASDSPEVAAKSRRRCTDIKPMTSPARVVEGQLGYEAAADHNFRSPRVCGVASLRSHRYQHCRNIAACGEHADRERTYVLSDVAVESAKSTRRSVLVVRLCTFPHRPDGARVLICHQSETCPVECSGPTGRWRGTKQACWNSGAEFWQLRGAARCRRERRRHSLCALHRACRSTGRWDSISPNRYWFPARSVLSLCTVSEAWRWALGRRYAGSVAAKGQAT
jgi:hypothetical protein